MAICGFCKNEVKLEGSFVKKKRRTSQTVLVEDDGFRTMYSCPHCNSVLGFTKY